LLPTVSVVEEKRRIKNVWAHQFVCTHCQDAADTLQAFFERKSVMSEFNLIAKLIVSVLLVVSILSGCSGMARQEIMAPVVPVLEPEVAQQYPYEIGQDGLKSVIFDHREIRVTISPVILSEKMSALFGPAIIVPTPTASVETYWGQLIIEVKFGLEIGTASFDPDEFVILVGESRRLIRPIATDRVHLDKERPGWSGRAKERVTTGPQILNERVGRRPDPYTYLYHEFTYNIDRHIGTLFVFRLGDMNVNRKVLSFPEVTFERGSRYVNR